MKMVDKNICEPIDVCGDYAQINAEGGEPIVLVPRKTSWDY